MRVAWALLAVLLVGLAAAAQDKAAAAKADLKKFAGTWVVFDKEVEGSGAARVEVMRFVFQGNKYSYSFDDNKPSESTFTVNPTADPKTIDVTHRPGDKPVLGIYRFKDGKLEICQAAEGKARPTAFATAGEPGAGRILYVLKPKTPPAKLDPAEAAYQEEMKKLAGNWTAAERHSGTGKPDKNPEVHGLLVEDGKVTTLFKGNKRDTMTVLRVDPKADPPAIDFRAGNRVWLGIYRVTDGKLELCMADNGKGGKRPTVFTTKAEPGAGRLYTVYSKDKK